MNCITAEAIAHNVCNYFESNFPKEWESIMHDTDYYTIRKELADIAKDADE